jgi:hypothetical protein
VAHFPKVDPDQEAQKIAQQAEAVAKAMTKDQKMDFYSTLIGLLQEPLENLL